MKIQVCRWTVDVDVAATATLHAAMPPGTGCRCAACRNFLELADSHGLPAELLGLLQSLGIAADRPAELAHECRLEADQHAYSGWYHAVGSLVAGVDAHEPVRDQPGTSIVHTEPIGPTARVGLTRRIQQPPPEAAGLALVQIEVALTLPWVLDPAEEPD